MPTFYPFSGGLGAGTGGIKSKTGTEDKDVALVTQLGDGTYGNLVAVYILSASSGQSEDSPTILDAADGGNEDWLLADILQKNAQFVGIIKAGSTPTTLTDAAGKILSAALNTVAVAQGGTGITSFGTGVATAMGNNVNSAGGLLTSAATGDNLTDSTTAALGLGTIELGHASDTTIARSGAGAITVEGTAVLLSGGALGTPSGGTLTNCSGLPVSGIAASTSTAIGVGSVELGHASDTTMSRVSAGVVAVEGVTLPRIIASGSVSFDPGSVSDGACSTAVDGGTATGVLTTDRIVWNPSGDVSSTTGYDPSGDVGYVWAYPTADHVNFRFCNKSGSAIDPGAITINWMVIR